MSAGIAVSRPGNAELLSAIEGQLRRYVATHPRYFLIVALWCVATHLFESFDAFPYIAITSPAKRCGKTRLAELMDMLSARSWRTVGATPAVIFRTIDRKRPTLIIDEAEILTARDERAFALREVLNAGYRKGQTVSRCDERAGHEPKEYGTYCPKVFVLIGTISGALADRCIEIRMERRTKESIERFRFTRALQEFAPLKQEIEAWAAARAQDVAQWYQSNDLAFIEDREEELWLPLFAVCAVLAPDRVPELERVAAEMAGAKAEGEPHDWSTRLLADVRAVFSELKSDRIATEQLISALSQIPDSPWPGWNHENGIYSRDVSRLLKPFGIYSQNIRFGDKVIKGYLRDTFRDPWERYLPPDT